MDRFVRLLWLSGAGVAGLAGNAVVLFAGMEVGNVGALLLAGDRTRARPGPRLRFAVQHGAALGLLAAAIQLQNGSQTTDFAALPAGAGAPAAAPAPWRPRPAARALGGA